MKFRNKNGISLIVLVITIIVMIILATAVIISLSDSNIIEKTKTAADVHNSAAEKEKDMLKDSEIEMAMYTRQKKASKWNGSIATGFSKGDGTAEKPYEISTGAELAYLASQVNSGNDFSGKVIKLTKDINLQNQNWTPVGGMISYRYDMELGITTGIKAFNGELDGNGKIIYNMTVNQKEKTAIGFIGYLGKEGKVKDITIVGGKVDGQYSVGGIVGLSQGTIEDCRNYLPITAYDDGYYLTGECAGGIVGKASGIVKNCVNNGNITCKNAVGKTGAGKNAGGIVGFEFYTYDLEIINCRNYGKVLTQYQQAGGIISGFGDMGKKLVIKDCDNYGEIVCEPDKITKNIVCAGGIIGYISTATKDGWAIDVEITNCTNEGNVIATDSKAGGIVGAMKDGNITKCVNKGYIKSNSIHSSGITGGIVGDQEGGTIQYCYNIGKLSSGNYSDDSSEVLGGVIGLLTKGNVEYCYSSSQFENGETIGAVVGIWKTTNSADVKNCYYTNDIIKGVGSKEGESGSTTVQDEAGVTEKIDYIDNFESFKGWLSNKFTKLKI